VGVVVLGFITLNACLTFIGITAILGRGVIERRKDIGILAAIGANKKTIYLVLLKDLLIISTIASGIGVILGFITAVIGYSPEHEPDCGLWNHDSAFN
jgi:ABC-type antimicrobial peptide transport system permease subunit